MHLWCIRGAFVVHLWCFSECLARILSYLMSSDVILCYASLPGLVSGCLMLSCPLYVLRRVMLSDDISRRHVRCYVILTGVRLGYLILPHAIPPSHSISRGTSRYPILSYALLSGGMLPNARSPDVMLRYATLPCRRLRHAKASTCAGRQRSTSQRFLRTFGADRYSS